MEKNTTKISIITPSIRPDRLKIVEECLKKQSFKSFEWVVSDITDKPKGYSWAFNKSMNDCIRRSKGQLLVSIQDSIWFSSQALEKFWFYFKNNPNWCVSGVGDQYDRLDDDGKPIHKIWLDPRKRTDQGTFYESNEEDYELNYASLPRHLIYEIGGCDEELDRWYGWDNVSLAYRLSTIGAKFFLDQTNESFSLQHDRNPNWDKNNWINHGLWDFLKKRPVKLDYLKSK